MWQALERKLKLAGHGKSVSFKQASSAASGSADDPITAEPSAAALQLQDIAALTDERDLLKVQLEAANVEMNAIARRLEDVAAGASELERHARTHAERIDASGHMAELERIAREAAEARALETEQQLVALQNEMCAVQLEKQVSSRCALVCDGTGLG